MTGKPGKGPAAPGTGRKNPGMPLTPKDVDTAYRLILGRVPSEAEAAQALANNDSLQTLRSAFLGSDEFRRKYEAMQRARETEQPPTLVHLYIPETGGSALTQALTLQPALQPNRQAHDGESLNKLRALPRPERRKLRYVHGHLGMGAGETLEVPYRYICLIRRPGPRLFSFYRYIVRTKTHPAHETVREMDFGQYLEFSVNARAHRVEMDNGQIRRLTGQADVASLGHEFPLLRQAVYNALSPQMIFGFVEHIDAFLGQLVAEGHLDSPDIGRLNIASGDDDHEAAITALTADQREIFNSYTAWDTYLYDVLETLLLGDA